MGGPDLALGTALWGWTIPPKDCYSIIDEFYRKGYRKVDGATNYPINQNPKDFRKAEQILTDWIQTHGVKDLEVIMKVGSVHNMGGPDNNLSKSFLFICLEDYQQLLGPNLHTFMIHWDNREDHKAIETTFECFLEARKRSITAGLSGIKSPQIYHSINTQFQIDFSIQCKHNLLQSDYGRYALFHGKNRFIVYGINAGGIKFSATNYHSKSSYPSRKGSLPKQDQFLSKLTKSIHQAGWAEQLTTFNQCGMIYAFYSPEIESVLVAPSNRKQALQTIEFHQKLKQGNYEEFYPVLKQLADNPSGVD